MRTSPLFLASILCSGLAAQGRPALSVSGVFGTAPATSRRAYAGIPDTLKLSVSAGSTRAGRPVVWFWGFKLLATPLPFGPDFIDLDFTSLFLATAGTLDSNGSATLSLPIPATLAPGGRLAFQPMVVALGENPPLRLARGKELVFLSSGPHLYVDGDAPAGGNGSPYRPYAAVGAALAAAKGGETIHIAPKRGDAPYTQTIYVRKSNLVLAGDDWKGGTKRLPKLKAAVTSLGRPRRGTLNVGLATSPISGITLRRLWVFPSVGVPTGSVKANTAVGILVKRSSKNVVIEDCLVEGFATRGKDSLAQTGIKFVGAQGVVRHCTITRLWLDPSVQYASASMMVTGIQLTSSSTADIDNCRIDHLAEKPPVGGPFTIFATGIAVGLGCTARIDNCVVGPIKPVPSSTAGTVSEVDIYGIEFGSARGGSVRNTVLYGLDARGIPANIHQIFGLKTDMTVEATNLIVQDVFAGKSNLTNQAAFYALNAKYVVTYSCVWNVGKVFFSSGVTAGTGFIQKDPLLVPPSFVLKAGSPCLGTGNPLYPPKNMGIYGGRFPGPAGRRP